MTLPLRILGRLLYLCAWLSLLLVAGLWLLELRGGIARLVEAELDAVLAPAGIRTRVDSARLRWFAPGIEVEGLVLFADGKDVLRLDRARVHLSPGPRRPEHWVSEVLLDGGRVILSRPLLDSARDLLRDARRTEHGRPGPPPRIAVRGLELAAHSPAAEDRRPAGLGEDPEELVLGLLEVDIGPDAEGRPLVLGRILPRAATGEAPVEPIAIVGREAEPGALELSLRVSSLPVEEKRLPAAALLPGVFGQRVEGALSAELSASVRTDGAAPPAAVLLLRLDGARVEPEDEAATAAPVDDLELAAEVRFAPGPGVDWWSAAAWDVVARADLRFRGAPARAYAALGRGAGEGTLLSAWVAAPDFELSREMLADLGLFERVRNDFEALAPRGRADAVAGVRIPLPATHGGAIEPRPEIDALVDLRHDGRSGVTLHGWAPSRTEAREGVPIPVEDVRGRTLFGHDSTRARALARKLRLAIRATGDHGSGPVRVAGYVASPIAGRQADVDVEVEVLRAPIGPGLATALSGLRATRGVVEDYGPAGGELDALVRVVQAREYGGTIARADVALREASLRWANVPAVLHDVHGEVQVRFAERPVEVEREDGSVDGWRPAGVHVALEAVTASGARAGVRVLSREEAPELPEGSVLRIPARRVPGMHRVEVDLSPLDLSGPDAGVLRAAFPELAEELLPFAPSGSVAIAYRGGVDHPGAGFSYTVGARPLGLSVVPAALPAEVSDLRGVIGLASAELDEPDEGQPAGRDGVRPAATHLAGTLVGTLSDGTPMAAEFDVASGPERGAVALIAGGVDPSAEALLDAARAAFARADSGAARAHEELALAGRVDVHARLSPPAEPDESWSGPARLHLRGNSFSSGRLHLQGLTGTLSFEGGVLSSDEIAAELAGTPVRVLDARFLDRSELEPLLERDPALASDPLLAQPGFLPSGPGYLATARLVATDILLDEEHLAPFLGAGEEDPASTGLEWQGTLDVKGARFLVTPDETGGTLVGVHGPVVPSGLSVDLGLPLRGLTGEVRVRSLVVKGGRASAWLEVSGLYGSVAGRHLDAADMTLTYLDGRLTIDDLHGELEGGSVASLGGQGRALALDLVAPHGFDLALQIGKAGGGAHDADVDRLLTGMFDSSVRDRGELRGELRLSGRLGHLLDLSGSGWVELKDVRLWSIPVVREVLSVLGLDRTAVFDRIETAFTVEGGAIHMHTIDVHSPLLRLVGEGTLDLDGTLDHTLDVRYGLIDRLGSLNRLLYWFQNNLVRVEVHGDLSRPQVFLRNGIKVLFGIEPRWEPALPLPDFRPLEPRF